MEGLSILLLLASAVQLYSAAPALEAVTCNEDGGAAAARLATHHIDEHHDHGYKFRLLEILGNKMEKVDGGCDIELNLNLGETVCHTVNPQHFEDCEYRDQTAGAVGAHCNVSMTVRNGDAKVTKYACDTHRELSDSELIMTCPDCPVLIELTSPEGLMSVNQAVKKFNTNTTNQHVYILQEVGRLRTGYVMSVGMFYYSEFVVVETHCPRDSRILQDACKPLCPDRAHHALCRSSYSSKTYKTTYDCDFYPPKNTTALGPGEQEPVCTSEQPAVPPVLAGPHMPPGGRPPPGRGPPPDHGPPHGHGPPPGRGPPHDHGPPHGHGHGHGPPPGRGPPHDHGPPPPHSARTKRSLGFLRPALDSYHPLHPNHPCHAPPADPAIHPICPWPLPDQQQNPRA
ncbi:alpha-2-HS-glycoprotein 1 [Epinephelus fuscoguttatus]|uniref:alpha-2-HS-glycoprotein 1 n=1 Tax=Epinephelus fuscoguttatus TaxID=293821 RepID=UPI0020D0CA74|nr:alpha-2-HS-glycoprotein 1 [Epinephelus fuscoguttatus]